MIVVQETNTSQTINYITRTGDAGFSLTLKDENTNDYVNVTNIQFYQAPTYYQQLIANFPTIQNHFYWLEIFDVNNDLILKERMFCTNQPIDTFSVNNNAYQSHITNNDFIMYE
jgi:hypothetical protein